MKNKLTIITLTIITILTCSFCKAQNITIIKSSEEIEFGGKIYYIHYISKGETLYSISRAYNVPAKLILECNNKKDYNLAIKEPLRIPKDISNDSKFMYLSMKKGETLFSVYKKTGTKVDSIIKYNPTLKDINNIAIGTYVKIPRQYINDTYIAKHKKNNDRINKQLDSIHYLTIKQEQQYDIDADFGKKEMNSFTLNDSITKKELNIAVFLPFYLNKNDEINKEEKINKEQIKDIEYKNIYEKTKNFIQFYQGFILACDSLKKKGYRITINTYDTKKNKDSLQKIISTLDLSKFDFIVGPAYSSTFHFVAEEAMKTQTPIISPLSDNTEMIKKNPYTIQLNTSERTVYKKTSKFIYKNFQNSNIIVIYPEDYKLSPEAEIINNLEDSLFTNKGYMNKQDITYTKISFDKYNYFGIKSLLNKNTENVIIVPTKDKSDIYKILPTINAFSDNYKISLIALPSWQRYKSLDPKSLFEMNTTMLTPYYINYKRNEVKLFIRNFRNKFVCEPNDFAFRAFDLGLYFISLAAQDKLYNIVTNKKQTQQTQACYQFEKDNTYLGFENKGLHVVRYDKNYNIRSYILK